MGWTSCSNWRSTKDALADEARCGSEWETVWHKGTNYLYRRKSDGYPAHTHFLVSRKDGEIFVKDIGDFHDATAAKKYIALAESYLSAATNEKDIKWVKYKVDEAKELLKHKASEARWKELKAGDKVYIKECFVYNGLAEVHSWLRGNRSIAVKLGGRLVRVQARHIDFEKTFG